MQGNNSVQGGNQNGAKQGGLSWSQPVSNSGQSFSSSPAKLSNTTSKPSTMSTNNKSAAAPSRSGLIGGFIGGLILGGLLAWGWFALKPASTPVAMNTDNTQNTQNTEGGAATQNSGSTGSTNTGTTNTTPPATSNSNSGSGAVKGIPETSNNSLTIPTQNAGSQVMITALSITSPTWIVIYDNNNGQPGKALGAGLVFPTTKAPVNISLLRPTLAGHTYIVGQRIDNGDHQYSAQTDKLVTDSSGKPVWLQFQTN